MSFKQEWASLNSGWLATEVINFHRPYQVTLTVPSVNTVFCVNGCIGELPIQFLLDSDAAVSVVNLNFVKQQPIDKAKTCTLGAIGTPLNFIGQMTVSL